MEFEKNNAKWIFPDPGPNPVVVRIELITPKPAQTILPDNEFAVFKGICTQCDYLGMCVWQHNYKLECEHYQ